MTTVECEKKHKKTVNTIIIVVKMCVVDTRFLQI